MRCPFCQKENQRVLGAIFLSAPDAWARDEATAGDRVCNQCLSLIAQLLDSWRDGGINRFLARARSAGILTEKEEYVESGTRRFNN